MSRRRPASRTSRAVLPPMTSRAALAALAAAGRALTAPAWAGTGTWSAMPTAWRALTGRRPTAALAAAGRTSLSALLPIRRLGQRQARGQ